MGLFALNFIIKNFKWLGLIALVGAILFQINSWISNQAEEKTKLQHQIQTLTKDRDQALMNFSIAESINESNVQTMNRMIEQQELQEKTTAKLEKKMKDQRAFYDSALNKIDTISPDKDGPIAPVLRDTIDAIQQHRRETNK